MKNSKSLESYTQGLTLVMWKRRSAWKRIVLIMLLNTVEYNHPTLVPFTSDSEFRDGDCLTAEPTEDSAFFSPLLSS
jgi:hypothetical protein